MHARFHVANWETKEKIFQTCDITTTIILSLIRFRLKRNPNCVTANCSCRGRRRQPWRGRRRGEPGLALFKLGRRRLCCATHRRAHMPVSTHRHAVPRGGHSGTFLRLLHPWRVEEYCLCMYGTLLCLSMPPPLFLRCGVVCYLFCATLSAGYPALPLGAGYFPFAVEHQAPGGGHPSWPCGGDQ